MTAISVSRWRFENEGKGRWWYTVVIEGERGARYEVELVHSDGSPRAAPYNVVRAGRSTRRLGRSGGDLRTSLEETARAALVTS